MQENRFSSLSPPLERMNPLLQDKDPTYFLQLDVSQINMLNKWTETLFNWIIIIINNNNNNSVDFNLI